jgi:hypothetical protein
MQFLAGRLPSPLRRVVQRRRKNEWVDCPVDKPTVLVGVGIESYTEELASGWRPSGRCSSGRPPAVRSSGLTGWSEAK